MNYIRIAMAAAWASILVLSPTPAAAQCDCSRATLNGTSVSTRLADQNANFPIVVASTVGPTVELPSAGPQLGLGATPPRFTIDYGANTIRVDFVGTGQSYAGAARFLFSNLHPTPPAGCAGPVTVAGITVQTTRPNSGFVTAGASFGPDSVTVPFAPPSGTVDWSPGQSILVTLRFACSQTPPPPPVGYTACCPPWNATQLQSMMAYQGTGGIAAPYTLKFNPTPLLHTQLNAYVTYLQSLGLGINAMLINFQLSDAGTGATPVPGTLISNQPVTWTGSGTPSPSFFANGAMSVNHWYRIQTAIILGGAAGSTFLPTQCLISYIDVRIQVLPSPQARPGAPTMQIRLADGQIVERPIQR